MYVCMCPFPIFFETTYAVHVSCLVSIFHIRNRSIFYSEPFSMRSRLQRRNTSSIMYALRNHEFWYQPVVTVPVSTNLAKQDPRAFTVNRTRIKINQTHGKYIERSNNFHAGSNAYLYSWREHRERYTIIIQSKKLWFTFWPSTWYIVCTRCSTRAHSTSCIWWARGVENHESQSRHTKPF